MYCFFPPISAGYWRGGYTARCAGTFQGKVGRIQVSAGLAPSSQTVGCNIRTLRKSAETGGNRWKMDTLFYPDPVNLIVAINMSTGGQRRRGRDGDELLRCGQGPLHRDQTGQGPRQAENARRKFLRCRCYKTFFLRYRSCGKISYSVFTCQAFEGKARSIL
jgi:hypothetical protein